MHTTNSQTFARGGDAASSDSGAPLEAAARLAQVSPDPEGGRRTDLLRLAIGCLLVCAAYYLGALVGLRLRLPATTPSVLWPPNAILTAALILTPPRLWPIYLLSAFPAHMVLEFGQNWQAPLVLALFLTNCSEALIGAIGLRLFSDAPDRFDRVPRVAVFMVVVVIAAPVLSSFPDAAIVSIYHAEPYWNVWQSRTLSNVLSSLTIVPALVMLVTEGRGYFSTLSRRQLLEAGLLLTCFAAVVAHMALRPPEMKPLIPGTPLTTLALLVPLLLWAAVRFGPLGSSLLLLATTFVVIVAAMTRRAPFRWMSPAEIVPGLQLFITVMAMPFLFLAALIAERKSDAAVLAQRLRFEQMLSRLSATLVHVPSNHLGPACRAWLGEIGEFLQVDAAVLSIFSRQGRALVVHHAWRRSEASSFIGMDVAPKMPWSVERLRSEMPIAFSDVASLPDEAAADRDALRGLGIRSKILVPIVANGRVLGGLGLMTMETERRWTEDVVLHLQLVAEVFANALARAEADEALVTSETMKSAILTSIWSGIAVLAVDGRVVSINDAWTRHAGAHQKEWSEPGGSKSEGFLPRSLHADDMPILHGGVDRVLRGDDDLFTYEYATEDDRWFVLTVRPLRLAGTGALVTLSDVSERRLAELEATEIRKELAHVSRVSAMGELAASLAHQLNQPLTSILSNGQVARRLLEASSLDVDLLRTVIGEIVDEDKRAGEVIRRLREMLRKGEIELASVDMNEAVSNVLRLVSGDAVIRRVSLAADLCKDRPIVRGGRIELQQAMLNLVMNAIEAVSGEPPENRKVAVLTWLMPDSRSMVMAVRDWGPGLLPDAEHMVFEPFYTTKPEGMGIGLSIAKSIVTAHGGDLRAVRNADRGVTFEMTLPMDEPAAGNVLATA
jgi:signal transduction histidine kinase/integral membrane sensor domain MASE1